MNHSWALRFRQTLAVFRLELKKSFSLRRSFWLPVLAFAPVVIITAHALEDHRHPLDEEILILAGIVQFFYLRLAIFFGCVAVFARLVRGDIMERTLHYYFLAPLRREAVLLGKFLAGYTVVSLAFATGVVASCLLMFLHFPAGKTFLWQGPGLRHLGLYLLVTVLACLGYGAVFLLFGLVFKNPALPMVTVFGWESINSVLPVWLKRFSVTFYLKPLLPVELTNTGIWGLFTVVADPMAAWIAVSGVILFALGVLVLASLRIRQTEINYSTD